MAIRQIRLEDDAILRTISKKVETYDKKLQQLIDDMIETMYSYDGIGLAAPQVGVLKRLLVYDVSEDGNNPHVVINPEVLKSSGEQVCEEGCLSSPEKFGYVIRPENIEVKGYNRQGREMIIKAQGIDAVVLSHEIDHLNGILFIDKVYEYTNVKGIDEGTVQKKKKKGKNK